MLIGIYIKNKALAEDARFLALCAELGDGGYILYEVDRREDLREGTDLVLSIGGDGTFLSASKRVADSGVPLLGVNLGRLGFLSENLPEDIAPHIFAHDYQIEDRAMLAVSADGLQGRGMDFWPYALNEVSVHRTGPSVLGVEVTVNGEKLPTYWADGLLVATSSGSTAYSLSAGGPICLPESKVLLITPIAPHNLNVRPLVIPETSVVEISVRTRDKAAIMTMDNRTIPIDELTRVRVSMAQFSLKRVRLPEAGFVKALVSKLYWGEDIRNNTTE